MVDVLKTLGFDYVCANPGSSFRGPQESFINYGGNQYGVYSAGPIEHPNDLGPAIRKAIDVVKHGEPALIDVVTQPR